MQYCSKTEVFLYSTQTVMCAVKSKRERTEEGESEAPATHLQGAQLDVRHHQRLKTTDSLKIVYQYFESEHTGVSTEGSKSGFNEYIVYPFGMECGSKSEQHLLENVSKVLKSTV